MFTDASNSMCMFALTVVVSHTHTHTHTLGSGVTELVDPRGEEVDPRGGVDEPLPLDTAADPVAAPLVVTVFALR